MAIGHWVHGAGAECVIVLPGAPGDHSSFAPTLPWLGVDEFTYAFVDYRGFGSSRELAGEYSLAELTADIRGVADHLGWQQFHLVGHSFGGMLAQRLAVDATSRIKSVVAVTPVPASGIQLDEAGRELILAAVDNDEHFHAVVDLLTGNRLSSTWIDTFLRQTHETTTPTALLAYLQLAMDADFASEVKGLPTPFLILVGEHDLVYRVELIRRTMAAWLPNAVVDIMYNCGHFPMLEIPPWFVTRVEAFMRNHA